MKVDTLRLIRSHFEGDDEAFRATTQKIAKQLEENGDCMLAEYVLTLLNTSTCWWSPQ